jgi:two-component system nitrogen regulation sensor histidine kinase NtrY
MVFKRYQIQILIRLILIVLTCYGITYVLQLHAYWFTLWNLILFVVLQVYSLFRFLTRWQQDLRVFANSVKHGDYNITYHLLDKSDAHFELYDMLNNVTKYVRQIKSEYVQQNHYFKYVVENAQVGLIAYDEKGMILLCNDEALKLTQQHVLKNIHDLLYSDQHLHAGITSLTLHQPSVITSKKQIGLRLSARLSKFIMDEKPVFLLSLLNIKTELEENELNSWQNLISVLTHEIMNSITPIHSLNGSMSKYLDRIQGNVETVEKAKNSLEVINRRSQSLMNFVDRYRKISTVPLPHIQKIEVAELINDVVTLLENDLKDITLHVHHNNEKLKADPSQIEQVLINILRNATHALEGAQRKEISINTATKENQFFITISDTGKGIQPELLEKIFIPFFTTRPEGSGIGLTLSRLIMQRHGGSIEVVSTVSKGTMFTLVFPYQEF